MNIFFKFHFVHSFAAFSFWKFVHFEHWPAFGFVHCLYPVLNFVSFLCALFAHREFITHVCLFSLFQCTLCSRIQMVSKLLVQLHIFNSNEHLKSCSTNICNESFLAKHFLFSFLPFSIILDLFKNPDHQILCQWWIGVLTFFRRNFQIIIGLMFEEEIVPFQEIIEWNLLTIFWKLNGRS